MEDNKWFLKSKTIWGLVITTLGSFAPVAKVVGFDWPSDAEIGLIGETGYALLSGIATVGGLAWAFYGRIVAAVKLWVVKSPAEPTEPVA